jgi:U32 family peptidase
MNEEKNGWELTNIPELLSPAGNEECLDYALDYGADAVYFGSTKYGMRSASKNIPIARIEAAVKKVHNKSGKAYLTCNTTPRNDEMQQLPEFLEKVSLAGVDALIMSDLGVLSLAKKYVPNIDIHISTQLGVTNYVAAQMLYELGAKRVVLARELSLNDISEIRSRVPKELEIECFVHGAMCVSFSGRCLISNILTGRDANRGSCSQPCRWKYHLVEETRPGVYMPIIEDETGTHILNSKDLCMIEHIPDIIKAGVNSLKIEGRAKNAYYTAVITNAYRCALDGLKISRSECYSPDDWILKEMDRVSHREYCTGFFLDNPTDKPQIFYPGGYIREWDLAGVVLGHENGYLKIMQRNRIFNGDVLEVLEPGLKPYAIKVELLQDEEGNLLECAAHPMMIVRFKCDRKVRKNSILRKMNEG